MEELESLVGQLNQLRGEIEASPTYPPPRDVLDRLQGVIDGIKGQVTQAQAALHADIEATVADLNARADAIQAKMQPKAKPAVAEVPATPEPWEDHQGIAMAQRQELVAALVQLSGLKPVKS